MKRSPTSFVTLLDKIKTKTYISINMGIINNKEIHKSIVNVLDLCTSVLKDKASISHGFGDKPWTKFPM